MILPLQTYILSEGMLEKGPWRRGGSGSYNDGGGKRGGEEERGRERDRYNARDRNRGCGAGRRRDGDRSRDGRKTDGQKDRGKERVRSRDRRDRNNRNKEIHRNEDCPRSRDRGSNSKHTKDFAVHFYNNIYSKLVLDLDVDAPALVPVLQGHTRIDTSRGVWVIGPVTTPYLLFTWPNGEKAEKVRALGTVKGKPEAGGS